MIQKDTLRAFKLAVSFLFNKITNTQN